MMDTVSAIKRSDYMDCSECANYKSYGDQKACDIYIVVNEKGITLDEFKSPSDCDKFIKKESN